MKIGRPLWVTGTLLWPQQFQQQDRWTTWKQQRGAELASTHPWGVQAAHFDAQALKSGRLKATRLQLCLPDGTWIDTDIADDLPPPLDLEPAAGPDDRSLVISLTLPKSFEKGRNCLFEGAAANHPLRYRQVWRAVPDIYTDEVQSFGVLQYGLSLAPRTLVSEHVIACPVARLVREADGPWQLDPLFVPPLWSIAAHPGLLAKLNGLVAELDAKREYLCSLRRESQERMADFEIADMMLYWLLHSINSHQPILADFCQYPARHPEQLYRVLAQLAGSLLTLSLDHDVREIPAYQHDQLASVFDSLMHLISTVLALNLPTRALLLPLKRIHDGHFEAALNDDRLREASRTDFYLSVRCAMPALEVQKLFPAVSKVGSPAGVEKYRRFATRAVALSPPDHIPVALPRRLQQQYFALDLTGPQGQEMLEAATCAIVFPNLFGEVKLELFALVRV